MTTPISIQEHRETGKFGRGIGHPNLYEFLYLVPYLLDAKVALEIGTEGGNSTCMIADALKRTGGILHSVDINRCPIAYEKVRLLGYDNVQFHVGDGRKLLETWREPIDFAFEDSAHTYENTLGCLMSLHPHMRKGGIIAVHDLNIPVVPKAINEFLAEHDYTEIHSEWGPGFKYMIKET